MTTKLRAIIVDDEQSARDNLRYLIGKYCSSINLVAEADKVITAVEKIRQLKPDIVFLDIEMPQKNGFELFNYFEELTFHVIFVTAYNHYAVKAFEVSAVDYLLKPIDIERLKEAEQKVLKQTQLNPNFEVLKQNIASPELKHIAIPYKSDSIIIKLKDIICIQANRVYSELTVFDPERQTKKNYTYAKKLVYFETNLPQNLFFRVHRSWIINISFIVSYSKKDHLITLKNQQQIPVSKSYKSAFERFIF
jgi:two-component system LytT family response regulator